jgi:hypothetical protein
MHILIGLLIATLLVWGWACGSVLVAIFLTLGGLFGLAILGLFKTGDPTLQGIAVGLLCVIWAPTTIRTIIFHS